MILADLILLLYCLVIAPKIAWERLSGKKHPAFFQRLGFSLPSSNRETVLWLHAVSVGEVKAAAPFFSLLKRKYPNAWFCITTTTHTGQEEAKRSLQGADAYLYLSFDFSFVVQRFVKKLKPDLFFLVESDIWPNLLNKIKKRGGKVFLISGKISARTASRWSRVPFLAKKIFSNFDLICLQSEEYAKRFLPLVTDPTKICITGNLKFDMKRQEGVGQQIASDIPFLTVSCTHASEEDSLLDLLLPGPWKIFLAPRHPERFEEVAQLLERKKISYLRLSQMQKYTQDVKVILVDAMGRLAACYSKSKLAIVGGSFIPGIGGHNVLEPCLYSCPCIFGPYTFAQKELVQKVLDGNAGLQCSLDNIEECIEKIFADHAGFTFRSSQLMDQMRGSTQATWEEISRTLKLN